MTATTTTVEEEVRRADWEDVDELSRRWPKSRVAALARPGMLVGPMNGNENGVIETVTTDIVIVRFEDGRVEPFYWGEVWLDNVQPNPAFIARAPEDGGLKLGAEASKVALLARRLAGVIDDLNSMEACADSPTAERFSKMQKELESQYHALWELAGEEQLLEPLGSLTPQDFEPAADETGNG
jgi:hypothetical protein